MGQPRAGERGAVTELRLSLTVADYERLRAFYRDAIGLEEVASWDEHGHGVVFAAGRATLELLDAEHSAHVDELEIGRPTGATIRLALEVPDSVAAAEATTAGGGASLAAPVETPWGDLNVRVQPPEGPALTLFSNRGPGS